MDFPLFPPPQNLEDEYLNFKGQNHDPNAQNSLHHLQRRRQ
ncbi:hypothetical protein GFS31_42740 (plasmid) [Leptolyngbya sp. BL0902]|nr:hypothetical protein GFS31_42740 [Leptolyngbya sp. BL0902]